MLILHAEQVAYCLVSSRVDQVKVQQPGLEYQGRFYLKDAAYPHRDKQKAIQQARQKLLEEQDQALLLVEEAAMITLWHHVRKAQKVSSIFAVNLQQLAAAMGGTEGVAIKNRQFRLKTYSNCFVGSEAVDWLVAYLRVSREEAVRVGQRLMSENWIDHVAKEPAFKDDFFFYRFRQEA
ncbi:MAG: hypothetical protein HC812_01620 [Leptolyngbya sp. RL_3_1]|nr:hypothetical protein [Leptolyngbya sp. RL_3_1]